jgi:hypothetical protein
MLDLVHGSAAKIQRALPRIELVNELQRVWINIVAYCYIHRFVSAGIFNDQIDAWAVGADQGIFARDLAHGQSVIRDFVQARFQYKQAQLAVGQEDHPALEVGIDTPRATEGRRVRGVM